MDTSNRILTIAMLLAALAPPLRAQRPADAETANRDLALDVKLLKEEIASLRRENTALREEIKGLKALAAQGEVERLRKELAEAKARIEQVAPRRRAEEFAIEDYSFRWQLTKTGDVELSLDKTQDALTVRLSARHDTLWMSPDEAEELASALARVEEYYAKLRGGTERLGEDVMAGSHKVSFSSDPKYGFSVRVRSAEAFSFTSVSFGRKEARDLAAIMAKAKKMAAFIDAKLKGALEQGDSR